MFAVLVMVLDLLCAGELLTADVGSTVMFSLPGNSQPWATDESFLKVRQNGHRALSARWRVQNI
jgi:hypothetical protein